MLWHLNMARATPARLPRMKTSFWPRMFTPRPLAPDSKGLKTWFTDTRVLKGLWRKLARGKKGLGGNRPEHHHDDHHDGEDRDRVAGHVHDEQVHGNLKI